MKQIIKRFVLDYVHSIGNSQGAHLVKVYHNQVPSSIRTLATIPLHTFLLSAFSFTIPMVLVNVQNFKSSPRFCLPLPLLPTTYPSKMLLCKSRLHSLITWPANSIFHLVNLSTMLRWQALLFILSMLHHWTPYRSI